jgi:hypothetical protein
LNLFFGHPDLKVTEKNGNLRVAGEDAIEAIAKPIFPVILNEVKDLNLL